MSLELTVTTVPVRQIINIGDSVQLTAHVNETDLRKLKFQWFKLNQISKQEESIRNSNSASIKIDQFNLNDAGIYRYEHIDLSILSTSFIFEKQTISFFKDAK